MDRFRSRACRGLSRLEVLLLIVVLVVLALACYGPVHAYVRKNSIVPSTEDAHTLAVLLSQYATDNNGVYPVGENTTAAGKSEGIARNLLENSYTPSATIFAVGSTETYRGTAHDFSDLAPENLSWDFTAGANASTGITETAPDALPIVYTTGETVLYPSTGTGLDLTFAGNGPFGGKGIIVAYKPGNAVFIEAAQGKCAGFISKDLKDGSVYTQIKP